MNIVKALLDFAYFKEAELVAFCLRVISALTANVNFPAPTPTVAEITALTIDYSTALSNAADGGKTLTAIKNQKRKVLVSAMRQLALNITANGQNKEAVILSSGFDTTKSTRITKPNPFTPEHLQLNYGIISGTVAAKSKKAKYALMYEFRYTEDEYGPDAKWIYLPPTTTSKILISGITPGKSIWVQVRSINRKGYSNWSDPANILFVR